MGGGIIPNIENSREINKWMAEWRLTDPFRVRYPDVAEYSYMSFRRNDEFGKSRLDFFLMDKAILGWVKNVWNEDRLGRDFDHKEVTVRFRKKGTRIYIEVQSMIYVQNMWGNVHCMISLMNI